MEPGLHPSVRTRLPPGIDARSTREHRVSRETPGDRPITRRPGSHVAARQNHTARPIPHGAAAGFPGGLHRSHHSHAVPVPSRQTQQETEQGSSAPQRHLRPHTLDVHCPQMLSTYQHRRSLVTTSRRLLASSTTCLCIHWGTRPLFLTGGSLSPHTGMHSRTVLLAPPFGPSNSDESQQPTIAADVCSRTR